MARMLGWGVVAGILVACGAAPPASTPSPLVGRVPLDLPAGAIARGRSLFGTDVVGLPTGTTLTPNAAPGASVFELDPHLANAPTLRAGNAVAVALSPDGTTLAVLTSGFNRTFDAQGKRVEPGSSEYVFFYDVSGGAAPREVSVAMVPNSFGGIVFAPSGDRVYVSGGPDDVVYELARDTAGAFARAGQPIGLGHGAGLGIGQSPYAAGLAVTRSGARLVVTNHENDTLTIVDTARRAPVAEVKLAPGAGRPGGEFPAGVVTIGEGRAFVACQRDREVVEVDLAGATVVRRYKVGGQPTKLVANGAGDRVYVANANSDTVSVLDPGASRVLFEIPTAAGPFAPGAIGALRGSNPNSLALSPDERTLYVTNGGNNTLAVVALDDAGGHVTGLVPTGFYPNAVAVSRRGDRLYVAHGKSPTGPNPGGPWSNQAAGFQAIDPGRGNEYAPQLTRGGMISFPVPAPDTLRKLTAQSLLNNRFVAGSDGAAGIFGELLGQVKHVIYVIGENRTYDQILGDLARADGDPRLVMWGEAITPNQHQLAKTFVALDRFFDAGGVSGDGWQWTMSGRTTDVAEKAIPVEYAGRGRHTYDWEGGNRGINVGLAALDQRIAWNPKTPNDPDLVPGTADVGAVDGPAEGGRGFVWDAAFAAGRSVRNYGVFCEDFRYGLPPSDPAKVPPIPMPAETETRVAFPTRTALVAATDPYYRGFDMNFADYWRFKEWEREFDGFVKKGDLPALELVRLPRDHLGAFDTAEDGVSTPDQQIADHDYALGMLVEKVSKSPFWESTVIVMLEDDAQNGADHVDAHRSIVFFAGGHVRRGGAVVSTPYTTPSVLRTIELLLGLAPLGQPDAYAHAMAEVFDTRVDLTPVPAIVPAVLRSTRLPLAPATTPPQEAATRPRGDAASWALAMRGMDFRHEDTLPVELFNRQLACGLGVAAAGCASEKRPVVSRAEPDDDDDD